MSPRRPAPETRERLLDAAIRLFLAQGYAASSVEQVCREAGLSKGAFFHLFPSKEAMAIEAIDRFADARLAAMVAVADRAGADGRDRALALLDALGGVADQDFLRDNCLLGVLGQELSQVSPVLQARVLARFDRWADVLARDLALAREAHTPGASWAPETVARHVIAVFEGALLLARAAGDPRPLRDSLLLLRGWLASLLTNPDQAVQTPGAKT